MSASPAAAPPIQGFPTRPLVAARTPRVIVPMVFLLVLGLLFGAGGVFMGNKLLPSLVSDHALRGKGAITSEVDLHGKCKTSKGVLTDCNGTVKFRTLPEHGSRVVEGEIDYMLMFHLDQDADLFVRYNPDRPEHFSLSWGQTHFWNRVGTTLSMVLGLLALGIGTGFAAFTPLRRARAFKASLASPRPVAVRVSNLRRSGKKITAAVHFWRDGKERTVDQGFRKDEEPLFLGNTDHALALLSPEGAPTVLDSSLSDLELSQTERERILVAANVWPA